MSESSDSLKAYIDRLESLADDKAEISAQMADVMKAAAGEGFDKKAIREVLRLRRLKPHERQEIEALVETYRAAIGMA